MRKKVINLIFLFCSCLVLTGCVESRILDELTMVTAMGFDINENGDKIIGTINVPIFLKDEPPRNKVISAQAELQKSILQIMQESSANQIAIGSLEVLLFGKELTKKMGILDLIDPFIRDPTIGTAIKMAVVDGEVKDLLNGNYGVRGNAYFISNSIDTAVEHGNLPMTNFHRFLIDLYSQGKTPYVPIIRKESEKELEIIGVGFFRYGKLVHQISMEEAFFFKLLDDEHSNGWQDLEIDGQKAVIQNILSKREFHLTEASPPYEVTVKIDLHGVINEYTGDVVKDKTFKKLEKKFEEEINKRGLELVNKFKELDIDPIGFGRVIKSKNRDFDYDKWRDEYYEDLKVKIDVNVDINEVGIVE